VKDCELDELGATFCAVETGLPGQNVQWSAFLVSPLLTLFIRIPTRYKSSQSSS
jgi:hypothetical protein